MNDYQFKLARLEGEFIWHTHSDSDETFIVLEGELMIYCAPARCTWSRRESSTSPML